MDGDAFPILTELGLQAIQRLDGTVYTPRVELYAKLDELGLREKFDEATKGDMKAKGGNFAWDAECVLRKLLGR